MTKKEAECKECSKHANLITVNTQQPKRDENGKIILHPAKNEKGEDVIDPTSGKPIMVPKLEDIELVFCRDCFAIKQRQQQNAILDGGFQALIQAFAEIGAKLDVITDLLRVKGSED